MNYYSRTKPNLIGIESIDQSFKSTKIQPPLKDSFTDILIYLYNNIIKNNILLFLLFIIIGGILYYRYNKKKEEYSDQRLTTFNPLQRRTNSKVNYLPTSNYNLPEPKSFPGMNHTKYNTDAGYGKRIHTGGYNPYHGYQDTNIEGVYGPPNHIETTSSFGDYATENNRNAFINYKDTLKEMNNNLINGIQTGPKYLSNVNEIEPPYA